MGGGTLVYCVQVCTRACKYHVTPAHQCCTSPCLCLHTEVLQLFVYLSENTNAFCVQKHSTRFSFQKQLETIETHSTVQQTLN